MTRITGLILFLLNATSVFHAFLFFLRLICITEIWFNLLLELRVPTPFGRVEVWVEEDGFGVVV